MGSRTLTETGGVGGPAVPPSYPGPTAWPKTPSASCLCAWATSAVHPWPRVCSEAWCEPGRSRAATWWTLLGLALGTPANALTSTHTHTLKFGVTTTVSCQVNDGALATSGPVAKALQYVQLNQTRVFTTDSTGAQTGNTILANETLSYSDATGAVSFTIAGPVDTAGDDTVTDTIATH